MDITTTTSYLIVLTSVAVRMSETHEYKPVFLMHGINSGADNLAYLTSKIQQAHPNTIVHNSNAYPDLESYKPLPEQILGDVGREFLNFSKTHKKGFHFLGYSQGGLIGRGLIETYPEHNVKNFIALSSPMAGEYGALDFFGVTLELAILSDILYQTNTQQALSVAGYWNDPNKRSSYLDVSVFLPDLDNERPSNMSKKRKWGFIKCDNFILIGGPDDGVILPWFSSQFSYVDKDYNQIPFRERHVYKQDLFGLKTVDEQKKLHLFTYSGVEHLFWPFDDKVIEKSILPFLD